MPCVSQNLLRLRSTDPSIEQCKIDAECFSISRIFSVGKDSPSSHSRTLKRDKEISVVLFGTTEITVEKREATSEKRDMRTRELNYAEVFDYLGIKLQNLWFKLAQSGQILDNLSTLEE